MNKQTVLSIVGPTAVGKTEFALQLIAYLTKLDRWQGFDVISADSRQVYQGLEILSGADLPPGFEFVQISNPNSVIQSYFEKDAARLYGVSMILPNQEWSVAHFTNMTQEILEHAQAHHRLPILVGGTGLYHRHLLNTDPILRIPPNQKLRQKLETASVSVLQTALGKIDSPKLESLNQSDRMNPRRLIRALEVSTFLAKQQASHSRRKQPSKLAVIDQFKIGLRDDVTSIQDRIRQRVKVRFELGAIDEVIALSQLTDLSRVAKTTTGFAEIQQYLDGSIDMEKCLNLWSQHELQYAKRQLTWWKKEADIFWFDIKTAGWQELAFQQVSDILGI